MIYEEKPLKNQLADDPELHQKIIDVLPIPIFYRNTNGIYLACNTAHEKLIGKPKDQIIGKSVYEVQPKEIADIFSIHDKKLLENPGEQIYETKIRHTDGSMHDVVFNKGVTRDKDGNVVGIVGSISDITDRKRAENRLEKAKESMIISSRMLHKISAGIIIVDKDFKVIDSNESFAQLMGEEIEELYETIPGLLGADVKTLVPEIIFKMISNVMTSGEDKFERDFKLHNHLMHISLVSIYKNRVVGAVIRDMSEPMLVRDEIINRAQRVNRQNIETVQKIAFLLGENASKTEELLNSIIESYHYGENE